MGSDSFEDIKLGVEAILFSYGDWLSLKEIKDTLEIDSELMVRNALGELIKKYEEGFSFYIEEEDGKWRMALKEPYSDLVTKVITGTEIPRKALKVLGVIAYEQPVTKTRLAEILGRSVKNEVEYLYRNKFLSYEKYGVGKYFKVTKKFYDYFKLEEDESFREQANKSINTYLEEPDDLEEDTQDNKEDKNHTKEDDKEEYHNQEEQKNENNKEKE